MSMNPLRLFSDRTALQWRGNGCRFCRMNAACAVNLICWGYCEEISRWSLRHVMLDPKVVVRWTGPNASTSKSISSCPTD